eukprot:2050181-Rhodomonas_salina.2
MSAHGMASTASARLGPCMVLKGRMALPGDPREERGGLGGDFRGGAGTVLRARYAMYASSTFAGCDVGSLPGPILSVC